jgi:hypothetical protein
MILGSQNGGTSERAPAKAAAVPDRFMFANNELDMFLKEDLMMR